MRAPPRQPAGHSRFPSHLRKTSPPAAPCAFASLFLIALAAPASADVHLSVAQDGSAQYTRIQDALAAVPASNTTPCIIDIKPGTYAMASIADQFKIASPYITHNGLGASPSDVILTGNYLASASPNDKFAHATTVVTADNFTAKNLTFANTSGDNTGQALAMYAKADKLSFLNCRFLGWQDTLRTEYGRQYFQNCYVEGDVDFIYGHASAFFDNSTLYLKSNGYVTASALLEPAGDYRAKGFVFSHCTITGPSANLGYLGRPWTAGGLAVYDSCKIGPVISSAGWSGSLAGSFFAEYHSMDLSGNLLNVSSRATGSFQLSAAQALDYSLTNWLSGPDNWSPATVPEPSSLALALPAFLGWISRRRR
jgi:pectinesterase